MDRINKDAIKDVLQDEKQGLHVGDIATRLINNSIDLFSDKEPLEFEKVKNRANAILLNETKNPSGIFTKVKNPKTKKEKKGTYKLKLGKKEPTLPKPKDPDPDTVPLTPPDMDAKTNLFVGKAGESAVMSELLFRGYNVNSMLVDDGVDIVASKNNMFYYLQVKTTVVEKNKIHATIRQKRFNDYIGTQIRYVVVARCKLDKTNANTNLYFVFDNKKIQELIFGKKINSNQDRIYIKIEIDPKDGKPYIYDEKREDISFYMNNFEL